jgi:hypothetical protein
MLRLEGVIVIFLLATTARTKADARGERLRESRKAALGCFGYGISTSPALPLSGQVCAASKTSQISLQ